jgi:uncharacterized membrane protein YkoI
MKYLTLIITVTLALASASFAEPKEKPSKTAPLAEPKVSKKDAAHAVLFQYRGANIEKIELVQGKDHPNWRVDVFQAGGRSVTQVEVDGMTGKITDLAGPGPLNVPKGGSNY